MLTQSTMTRKDGWINITPINAQAKQEIIDYLEPTGCGYELYDTQEQGPGIYEDGVKIHTSEIIGEADHIENEILAKHGPVITNNK